MGRVQAGAGKSGLTLPGGGPSSVSPPGLLASVRRYWALVLVVILAASVAGYLLGSRRHPVYRSRVELLAVAPAEQRLVQGGSPAGTSDDPARAPRTLENQAKELVSDAVLARAAGLMHDGATSSELAGLVSAEAATGVDLIKLTATAATPGRTVTILNAVTAGYNQTNREVTGGQGRQLLGQLAAQRQRLLDQIASLSSTAGSPTDPITIDAAAARQSLVQGLVGITQEEGQVNLAIESGGIQLQQLRPPTLPAAPATASPLRDALLAALIAAAAAGVGVWWLSVRAQSTVRRDEVVQDLLNAPLLGRLHSANRPSNSEPAATAAEHFVISSLDAVLRRLNGNRVMLTAPTGQYSNGDIARDLAAALGANGRRVVVVAADLPSGDLARYWDPRRRWEVRQLLDGSPIPYSDSPPGSAPWAVVIPRKSDRDPGAFFHGTEWPAVMERLRTLADIVLVDAPSLLEKPEALAVAEHCDGIALLVGAEASENDLQEVRARLRFTDTPLIGFVLVNAPTARIVTHAGAPLHADLLGRAFTTSHPAADTFVK